MRPGCGTGSAPPCRWAGRSSSALPLLIWLAEKIFCDSDLPSTAGSVCSPSLSMPRVTRLVFFTGCWITAALPESQAQPNWLAGDAAAEFHSFSA